jgi:hypothetical protein
MKLKIPQHEEELLKIIAVKVVANESSSIYKKIKQ